MVQNMLNVINLTKEVEDTIWKISTLTDDFSKVDLTKIPTTINDEEKKNCVENFNKLLSQLPHLLLTKDSQLISYIQKITKRNNEASISFSPIIQEYKEFKCCKPIKFEKGNIITGRDEIINNIILTLCKKNKRGVMLIGSAGVGKTAIISAVSSRLIQRTVPKQLIGCEVLNLDVPYIFCKYKEDPIGTIIKVLEKASTYDKCILFVDEAHQLLDGRMNNILKPYLTESIRFIGSTTIDEYHEIITNDKALERRFTVIEVKEPSVTETIKMVQNTKSTFEEQHNCTISDQICNYLVQNGSRFLGHRKNPDKSLDLLDIACSLMTTTETLTVYDKVKKSSNIFINLDSRTKELDSLRTIPGKRILNEHYIDSAISNITGIKYEEIKNSLNFYEVYNNLKSKIFGQNKALESLANMVNLFKHTSYDRNRPICNLLLVGPPGVGKKQSVKQLTKLLYGSESHFIEMDLSGLTSEFMITELKGAPPGYVGYGRSGGLIKAIRNNQQCVVFFRGANKTHPTILQYLIDSSRKGFLLDSSEKEAPLNNAILIYSITLDNEQYNSLSNKKVMGFGSKTEDKKEPINDILCSLIDKSLINSVDDTIIFDKLQKDSLEKIFDSNVDQYLKIYDGVSFNVTDVRKEILESASNGREIISKLESLIPKKIFEILKKEGTS